MNEANTKYERFDRCCGTVIDKYLKCVYLELDNDERAFVYKFEKVFLDDKVLCTVLKQATEGRVMLGFY